MHGLGTIANAGAIVIGGLLGLALKKGLKPRFQEMLMQIMGICVMFLGLAGALTGLMEAGADGELTTRNSMLLIASMTLGGLVGEWINIAHWLVESDLSVLLLCLSPLIAFTAPANFTAIPTKGLALGEPLTINFSISSSCS